MNIVSIITYPFLPSMTGGQKAHALFYKYFSRYHQVTCISTRKTDPGLAEGYRVMNILADSRWRYINPFYFFRIRRILREQKAGLLIIEHAYLGWLAVLLKRFCRVKLLVHSHNAEGMRWKSLGKWWWWIMDSYEGWTLRRADYNFFMTDEDKAYGISRFRLRPDSCITITVGIERAEPPAAEETRTAAKTLHEKYRVPAEEPLLFFNGAFRYKPNREALENLLFRVNPILQEKGFAYRLLICGLDIPQAFLQQSFPGVELAGFAEDLELYLKGTDVFLNPVLTGGGIKTKLVEALGFNLNAVSTQSGAAGVDPGICNGKLIICADGDWQAFAWAIMEHAVKQKDTPAAFYEQFYWGNIAKKAAGFIRAGEGGRL